MKQIMKKSTAFLMAILLVFAMLPGISFQTDAATVVYQYGSTKEYSNVIKNWGTRGELATFLSPKAEEFYEGTSYESLAAKPGSADITLVDTSALYVALYQLMSGAHTTKNSYNESRDLFQYTDIQKNGGETLQISSFYSGKLVGPVWDGGSTWNREHVWPDSKGGSSDTSGSARTNEADIMMLRPAPQSENSSRGNKAYGVSSGYYFPNLTETYDVRGDVARTVLYTYVRWGTEESEVLNNMWGSNGVIESLDVLLDWIEADPVDTWEMGRNDSVQSITGTRNVFVDYPELAFELFEEKVPANYDTPSGSTSASDYTITARSNNTAYGTVSVNGNNVTAHPASGYQVAGCQVTSGTATVTQNGNIFTVKASSDCTILISFKPADAYTVQIVENGVAKSSQQFQANQSIKLPAFSGTLPDGYVFCGWVTENVSAATQKPSVYNPGEEVRITANTSFYAAVSYFDTEAGGSEKTWSLVHDASQLSEGKEVIIAAAGYNKAMGPQSSNNNNRTAVDVTKDMDSLIFDAGAGVQILTLKKGKVNGTYAFYTGSGYLYAVNNSSNYLRTQSTLNDAASFYITVNGDNSCSVTSAAYVSGTSGVGNVPMQYNNPSSLFACYPKATQSALSLYVGQISSGTTYYTTSWSNSGCSHANETEVVTDPTCTEQGYTTYFCADCGEELYAKDYVAALGHSYQSAVTKPTFSAQGYTTYTCSLCGDSYVGSYTDPLTNVDGWNLTLGSDLSVNFKINVDASIRSTAKIRITVANVPKVYDVASLTADADGSYYVSVKVAAAQMTDLITVQIVNGTEKSEEKTYTVKAYADAILAGNYPAETKTLITQMLHYGAAAQTYFDYHTDALANAGLQAANQTAPNTADAASFTDEADGISYSGAALVFREKIAVRYYFNVAGDISAYSFTADGKACTPVKKGDRYYIEVADINPQDLDQSITVQVNGTLKVVYSPMNYIVNMLKKGSENLQALVQALYDYHLAAEAYLAA